MKKLQYIIVDDEISNQRVLINLLERYAENLELVGTATRVNEAEKLIREKEPHIVFLDIEMPEGDGFSLIDKFENPAFQVIFTTAHANYAVQAIKVAALDYLLKPINVDQLKEAVQKAQLFFQSNSNEQINQHYQKIHVLQSNIKRVESNYSKISLPISNDEYGFFDLDDILYCEADKHKCIFHFLNGDAVKVSHSLRHYDDILRQSGFMRIHKNYIINLQYADTIEEGEEDIVHLKFHTKIPISERKKEELKKRLEITG